jgi:PEP-CTERM motif
MRRSFVLVVIALAVASPAFADSVHFNSGWVESWSGYTYGYNSVSGPGISSGSGDFALWSPSAGNNGSTNWAGGYAYVFASTLGGGWKEIYGNLSNGIVTAGGLLTATLTGWEYSYSSSSGWSLSYFNHGAFTELLNLTNYGWGYSYGNGTGDLRTVVPEPSSLMLLATGLLGIAGVVKRKFAA